MVTAEAAGTGYDVRLGSNVWNLCRDGWASTTWVLMKGDSEVGRVESAGVFTSGGVDATFDHTIPFVVQVFTVYLFMTLKRQAS